MNFITYSCLASLKKGAIPTTRLYFIKGVTPLSGSNSLFIVRDSAESSMLVQHVIIAYMYLYSVYIDLHHERCRHN